MAPQVRDTGSTLYNLASWMGTGVSGAVLYVIAALNVAVLVGIVRVFFEMRAAQLDEQQPSASSSPRG